MASSLPIVSASASDSPPPLAEELLALAPLSLFNYRQFRYQGDSLYVSLEQLAARDQTLLRELYKVLGELLNVLTDNSANDAGKWREVACWTQRHKLDNLIGEVREIGLASHAQGASEALAKAIHDVRGGALSPLLGYLQLLERVPRTDDQIKTLFVLTRDHLKIMRNALVGLDDTRRNSDRRPKSHDMRLVLEKWNEALLQPEGDRRPVRMVVDCRHQGAMAECCLESAAVDRIFYNLAHNACRHAASERLDMTIFPIPAPPGGCLRFVLSNEVGEADAAYLGALTQAGGADSVDRGSGQSLLALFEPQVSSTGSGFGLTVVAEFVAEAFGLGSRAEALRERYVGAVLEGRVFRAWFHWPMASNDLPHLLNDPRRPQLSLDEA